MSYRPHNSGHDYYDKGIYLITLVVGNRDRLLGELNMDVHNPSVSLSSLGSAVMDEWRKTAAIQASKDRRITLHAAVCMPSLPRRYRGGREDGCKYRQYHPF